MNGATKLESERAELLKERDEKYAIIEANSIFGREMVKALRYAESIINESQYQSVGDCVGGDDDVHVGFSAILAHEIGRGELPELMGTIQILLNIAYERGRRSAGATPNSQAVTQ